MQRITPTTVLANHTRQDTVISGNTGCVPKRWKEVKATDGSVFLTGNPEYTEQVQKGEVIRQQSKVITDDDIRAVLLSSGFTVKEGQDDLMPYVFTSVRRIEQLILNRLKNAA